MPGRSLFARLRSSPLLLTTTLLLILAAALGITALTIILSTPQAQASPFWQSVVFADLASLGTFAAAGAAWLTALLALRSRDDESRRARDSASPGMNRADLEFLTSLMDRMSSKELRPDQIDQLIRMRAVANGARADARVALEAAEGFPAPVAQAFRSASELVDAGSILASHRRHQESRQVLEDAIDQLLRLRKEAPDLAREALVAALMLQGENLIELGKEDQARLLWAMAEEVARPPEIPA